MIKKSAEAMAKEMKLKANVGKGIRSKEVETMVEYHKTLAEIYDKLFKNSQNKWIW